MTWSTLRCRQVSTWAGSGLSGTALTGAGSLCSGLRPRLFFCRGSGLASAETAIMPRLTFASCHFLAPDYLHFPGIRPPFSGFCWIICLHYVHCLPFLKSAVNVVAMADITVWFEMMRPSSRLSFREVLEKFSEPMNSLAPG